MFQSSLLRCFYCDEKEVFGKLLVRDEVSILFIEVFLLWRPQMGAPSRHIRSTSILFIEVFLLWRRRRLYPLISLVPYATLRTPLRDWNFLGNIALVQKWLKCRFPLCDAGLRVSEHLRGFCRSSLCSEKQSFIVTENSFTAYNWEQFLITYNPLKNPSRGVTFSL